MAQLYQILCPDCGSEFEVIKGCLVSECNKPLTDERKEGTPFKCPKCGRVFCVKDKDFNQYVSNLIFMD